MQEAHAREHDADRAVSDQAAALIAIATAMPHRYRHGGVNAASMQAMQNPEVVGDLVKLGLFCAGLDEASRHVIAADRVGVSLPTMLVGLGLHYAIEVAPRAKDDGLGPLIDTHGLSRHVRRIEGAMGLIEIDPRLLDAVNRLARERLMRGPEMEGGAS